MRALDAITFARRTLRGHPLRTGLTILAMGIGVAAVVVLTALGEGARRYVIGEFSALGTNLVIVLPGRNETSGGAPPMTGETPRDLTIDDALALYRSRAVTHVAPINVGEAAVSRGRLDRESVILGSTAELENVRELEITRGRFLPAGDPRHARPVCVIGDVIRKELFGTEAALGQWVRIGERRFRVIGTLGQRGQSLGVNMDEVVVVPVASAQMLFNTPSLFRILVEARDRDQLARAQRDIRRIIRERHEGEEDVTVITQDSVLAAFDRIFRALTLTVAGIAAVSLVVAGILVMNVMLVAVAQRTAEIGLLKALGANRRQVLGLFLAEAALLSSTGALAGLLAGLAGSYAIARLFPALPTTPPVWAVAAGLGVAIGTGLVFAVLPARRAARLDPVEALARR